MTTPGSDGSIPGLDLFTRLLGDPELRRLGAELAAKKVKADIQMLQHGAELSWRMLQSLGRATTADDRAHVADEVKRLVRANIEHYSALIDAQLAFSRRLVEPARVGAPPTPGEGGDVVVCASARPGETVHVPIEVRSRHPHPLVVTFDVTPFLCDDGSIVVRPPVAFEPREVALAPGESARVRMSIPVTDAFVAGRTYAAAVLPAGIEDLRLTVQLTVLAPGAAPEEPPEVAAAAEVAAPAVPRRRRRRA